MNATEKWLVVGVMRGADTGAWATVLRAVLTPLAWLHRVGLGAYLLPFHLGLRKRYRLPVRVVSIGNLSSGGTGKTPATAHFAQEYVNDGKRVVILSRGHRGKGETGNEPRVVSDGVSVLLTPDEAGDEPVLLANLLPTVPVIVCRDRRKSGKLAVEKFAPDIILLDDGLQYWQLFRDLDIVLLDARAPFDNGYVLPRGLLREPPAHLHRAGTVILTRADRVTPEELTQTKARIQTFTRPGVAILAATHAPVGFVKLDDPHTLLPLNALANTPAVVFSGIADGEAFAATVANLGIPVTATHLFGDHHTYTAADIETLAASVGNGVAITTEKDAVKLAALPTAPPFPVYALRVRLQIL